VAIDVENFSYMQLANIHLTIHSKIYKMAKLRQDLATWRWRMINSNGVAEAEGMPGLKEWTPVSAFPSVIQMELIDKKIIPDPQVGENERLIQWVGEVDWEYECLFNCEDWADNVDLVFDGLDTFATVFLNDQKILESDNMFIPARVSARDALNGPGKENRLRIIFESALKRGTQLENKFGARTSMMRDKKRMHIRKAQVGNDLAFQGSNTDINIQYHWGWDWGPIVVTAGPYLPIYLEIYKSRIDNIFIRPTLDPNHISADIDVELAVVSVAQELQANLSLLDPTGREIFATTMSLGCDGKFYAKTKVSFPKLWWPNGQGAQDLYTANVVLVNSDSTILDTSATRFGIRTIEVIQQPLVNAPGKTFMFRVNGRNIFAQGGDWIPADNLLPTISRQRYFDWIKLAKFSHLNMIRVWGGGIYETDDFFDACDEMGMLVWHDYMFACGDFPIHDEFLESISKEAEIQTKRMRNRASLALLCGGNEDFMLCDWTG
jgi:beta-mannosidase